EISNGVNTSKTQNACPVLKEPIQKVPRQTTARESFVAGTSSASVEDQLGELSLDQIEEEQLQELMEDWD
ncbi:hypothetical protein, partial [uncultured Gimesia sp.]|uniref:hypothetical protein n=1 Tax=uncultured Gimesia sp. TaxID=1678688 RepID=UPI002621645D